MSRILRFVLLGVLLLLLFGVCTVVFSIWIALAGLVSLAGLVLFFACAARFSRKIWRGEKTIPNYLLFWKFGQVVVPQISLVILLSIYFFTRTTLQGWALVLWTIPILIQGYGLTIWVIITLTKTRVRSRDLFWLKRLAIGGTGCAFISFFSALFSVKFGVPSPAFGNLVLLLNYIVEAGLSVALIFCREVETKLSMTFIPSQLWALYLVPPFLLHIFAVLWVLGVDDRGWWFVLALCTLLSIINGCWFFALGVLQKRFPDEPQRPREHHILLALSALIVQLVSFVGGVVVVTTGAYSWLLLVMFGLCITAVILIPVRWSKPYSRQHYRLY